MSCHFSKQDLWLGGEICGKNVQVIRKKKKKKIISLSWGERPAKVNGLLSVYHFKQRSTGLSHQTAQKKNKKKLRRMEAAGGVFHLGLLNISQHDQFDISSC